MLEVTRNELKSPAVSRLSASRGERNDQGGSAEINRQRSVEIPVGDRSGLRAGLERLEALARSGPGAAGRSQALGEVMVARAELAEARLQAEDAPVPPSPAPQVGPVGPLAGPVDPSRPVMLALPSASKAGAIAVARGRVESARAHLVAARTLS